MHDPEVVFRELKIREGYTFLDLGCGAGDYSIQASKMVGDSGIVYALDKWKETTESLEKEVHHQGIKNIQTKASSIEDPLPIDDHCVDVCLISTVLHTLDLHQCKDVLFNEIHRILKKDGRVAIIECKKIDTPFGPPKSNRWSPNELEEIMAPYGFKKIKDVELGYNYMILLSIE
ncbi:class I SAM-dependent methyltransferase [Vallitalea pronyensis]|uniref:Class I SAM-dependent methyltransferase n=1 Tax=Vallitalea pronyensis TaxID=1348613 RepID=A0A8J8SHY4_9FIRM|nr:class I SAM-dependent methyltransferase [Vallitalea pronyensis]QUI23909.1 class I SAM-dependent methyltransferase [Vallitalea pronyensis]